MLCLAYPTIILELKSKKILESMATKNNFISAWFVLIATLATLASLATLATLVTLVSLASLATLCTLSTLNTLATTTQQEQIAQRGRGNKSTGAKQVSINDYSQNSRMAPNNKNDQD